MVCVRVCGSGGCFTLQTHISSFVPAQFNSEVLLPLIPVRTLLQSELDVELAHALFFFFIPLPIFFI